LINVELINARDETQIWGEQYARKTSDLLHVQSIISKEVARKLHGRLTGEQERQLARNDNVNPEAYELLLKGNFYWYKGGTENRKKSLEFYNQAIAVDPNYAVAYAELSASYSALIGSSIVDPKEFTPKIEETARKALELDESLADGHKALADFKRTIWEWEDAEREYRRATELNPNHARARTGYAFYLSLMGRHEQAIAEVKRARELDPLSLGVNANTGLVLYFARRYDQAIEALKKITELDQNYANTYLYLGYCYTGKEMYREAISAYQEAIRLGDDSPSLQVFLGEAFAKSGEREKAQTILEQLKTSKDYVSPAELAVLYASLGDREQAFAFLEKAFVARDVQLQYLGVDPSFDPLRSDPRFQDLLQRVGLG
jgi:tetratricopeptide (TPR) repeat protein